MAYMYKSSRSTTSTVSELMNMNMIIGGCLCGSVKYEVVAPANCVIHCHCSRCRKGHASLFATCAVVEKSDFQLVQGMDALTSYTNPPNVSRMFCSVCGCSILYTVKSFADKVFYYPATIDHGAHPGHPVGSEHHIYVESKAQWEQFETSLPWHHEDFDKDLYNQGRDSWVQNVKVESSHIKKNSK